LLAFWAALTPVLAGGVAAQAASADAAAKTKKFLLIGLLISPPGFLVFG
jgi:hypothetical protein